YVVRNYITSGINDHVRKPIKDMSLENLDFLLIPMNRSNDLLLSGHQWTLLVLDVKRTEWQFLSSMVGEVEDP
ncbi:hypothetical protein MKX01_014242, partial [Papaver californicum]